MTWVKLDMNMPENAKVLEAGPLAAWLHVCGIAYCNRHLTDGFIPDVVLSRLADIPSYAAEARVLVRVGLWERDDERRGYWVHDYHDYQPSAVDEKAKRKAKQEAGRLGGQRSAEVRAQREGTAQPPASKHPEAPASKQLEARTVPNRSVPIRTEPQYTPEFDGFWGAYPRKIEKRSALRAWGARMKEGVSPDELTTAAEHYAEDCRQQHTEPRFIKHAATFLGPNRPWEDWRERPRLHVVARPAVSDDTLAAGARWLGEGA